MKKILILILDMKIGGAQKSLLSFCQTLASSAEGENYEVHLMPINPSGDFMSQIPEQIQIRKPPAELRWLGSHFSIKLLKNHFSIRGLCGEFLWLLKRKLNILPSHQCIQQALWKSWKNFIPRMDDAYDVAVSYMDGVPNYYVMDKVQAKKKVLWVHSEYQKQGYDASFDAPYFEKCDGIITISEKCRNCMLKEFPDHAEKIHILENITSGAVIVERSKEHTSEEFSCIKGWKLLSVGRLNPQKGFDLAIRAARELRDAGQDFLWLIVGEGTERQLLQGMIEENNLSGHVCLIGARENPYVYMRECDILIQPSRVEGKSIVLDEAKILRKPIVATNYTTVRDSLEHGKTGWIVEMNASAIAAGIQKLCEDRSLREHLSDNLNQLSKGNEAELKKYIEIMF